MIPVTIFAGRDVAVFGLGLSGIAAAHALAAGGARVLAWDDTQEARDKAAAQGVTLRDLAGADWTRIAALVLAPGIPLTHPEPHWSVRKAQEAGVEVIGDTELFFRERARQGASAKVVVITGTNGKSTTTALTAHLLQVGGRPVALGGNIGRAVLDLPPFATGLTYVLELSTFQIDLTPSLAPDAAALINITPDHLDRHGTIENYAAIKARVFADLPPERHRRDRRRRRLFPRHRRCASRAFRGEAHRRRPSGQNRRVGEGRHADRGRERRRARPRRP